MIFQTKLLIRNLLINRLINVLTDAIANKLSIYILLTNIHYGIVFEYGHLKYISSNYF